MGVFDSANKPEDMGLPLLDYPETSLVGQPMMNPDVTMMWPGKKLYLLLASGNDKLWENMALCFSDFVKERKPKSNQLMMDVLPTPLDHLDLVLRVVYNENPILKGGIGTLLRRSGCVNNMMTIVAGEILGCSPVYQVGVDNSFVNRQFRATGYVWDGKRFRRRASPKIDDLPPEHLLGYMIRGDMPTLGQFWSYLRGLVAVAKISTRGPRPMNIVYAGKEFGLTGPFPRMDIEDVVNGAQPPQFDPQKARAIYDDWLARNPYEEA
jgi:hypothetical protein